jgi:hypothetical protein
MRGTGYWGKGRHGRTHIPTVVGGRLWYVVVVGGGGRWWW